MKKLIAIALIFSTGCSALKPVNDRISINCRPMDATVLVNGNKVPGITSLEVPRNQKVTVQAYKDGYLPYSKVVDNHLSIAAILDAFGTFIMIFPVLGLITPGAWDLDQNEFNINLAPYPTR